MPPIIANLVGLLPLAWAIVALAVIWWSERRVHSLLHHIGFYLFGDEGKAILFHAAIFLPGVALHEVGHWIFAAALGLGAGRISLMPERKPDGNLRLGYAEVGEADFVRGALVGVAPLICGSVALVWIVGVQFDLAGFSKALAAVNWAGMFAALTGKLGLVSVLWLYAVIAVANSMLPSPVDRKYWFPAAIVLIGAAWLGSSSGFLDTFLASFGTTPQRIIRDVLSALGLAWTLAGLVNLGLWPILGYVARRLSVRRPAPMPAGPVLAQPDWRVGPTGTRPGSRPTADGRSRSPRSRR